MLCEHCGAQAVEVDGFTDDARTRLRCTACGHAWIHSSSATKGSPVGSTGSSKHFCPVCPYAFKDQSAPILTIGTPSKSGHRCDRTKSFLMGVTYGASPEALDARLRQVSDEELADWPQVLEMKRERLGVQPPAQEPAQSRGRSCFRCGSDVGSWLVTAPYAPMPSAGRLLLYCDPCRVQAQDWVGLSMPVALLDRDPESVLLALYETRTVGTDPDVVSDMLAVPGDWVLQAKAHLPPEQGTAAAP